MTPKEYLQQIYNLDREVDSLLNEYDKSMIVNLSASKLKQIVVDSSHVSNATQDTVLKRYEYGNDILNKANELIDLKIKISSQIDQLEERNYRILLRERYLNCSGWLDIAEHMNYDPSWIYRMHGDALEAFEEKHQEIFEDDEISE